MTILSKPVVPSLIENTTMQLIYKGDIPTAYYITPNKGYMLHDKLYDTLEVDNETMIETGNIIKGYRRSTASCSINYDFEANPREFYAVAASETIEVGNQEVLS